MARGDLTAAVVDLLQGAPELTAYGAIDAQLRAGRRNRLRPRFGCPARARAQLGSARGWRRCCPGSRCGARWCSASLPCTPGMLDGVLLAVIALVPLAAFELVTDLPTATQTLAAGSPLRHANARGDRRAIRRSRSPPTRGQCRWRHTGSRCGGSAQVWRRRTLGARRPRPRTATGRTVAAGGPQWRR